MIAIPGAMIIQGDQEQVTSFQIAEELMAVFLTAYGFTQRGGQLLQDGSLAQEAAHLLRLAVQYFLEQIIQYVTMCAPKSADKLFWILALFER
jgi:hypothetical protein